MPDPVSFVVHIDQHLTPIVNQFGSLFYAVVFVIIFAETGLVVTPFLPGDSLLFALGTLAAAGLFNPFLIFLTVLLAAFCGDNVNYFLGKRFGRRLFRENSRFFKKDYLLRTEKFYEKYGTRAIILGRFIPIVRTFVPFVAGVGKMHYPKFLAYSLLATTSWCGIFISLGYFFGNLPLVKENFSFAIIFIVLLSIAPGAIEFLRHKLPSK